ncbi:hypothetical protein ACWD0A_19230 [Streptomyces sp. NPDC002867]
MSVKKPSDERRKTFPLQMLGCLLAAGLLSFQSLSGDRPLWLRVIYGAAALVLATGVVVSVTTRIASSRASD